MNILVLSQYFWPENFRINELVQELSKKKKINLEVLTSKPSYPNKFFFKKKNYNKFCKVKIRRVPVYLRSGSMFSKCLNYITFVFSALIFLIFRNDKKYDKIIVFQVSPIFSALPAIIYSKFNKCRIYIWVLDLWPESIKIFSFNSKILFYLIRKISDYIYSNADFLLAQSRSISQILEKRYKKKVFFFPNWSEEVIRKKPNNYFEKKIKKNLNRNNFNIFFGGNLGKAQDIDSLLATVKLVNKKTDRINWFIFGEGSEKNKILDFIKDNPDLKNLHLLDTVTQEIFFYIVTKYADSLLVCLGKDKPFRWTVPGKIQFYLRCKLPIVGMLSGEAKNLIKVSNSGFVVNSGEYKKFSSLLLYLLKVKDKNYFKKKGINGFKYYKKNFKKKNIMAYFQSILEI